MLLRARLLLLIGAALIPAAALQIDAERQARGAREAEQRAEALRLVRLVSADLESVVDGARQFLAAIANLDAVTEGDVEACNRTLGALRRDVPRYSSFSVADAAGRTLCGSAAGLGGQDVSARAWFRLARESSEFAVGEYAIGLRTGLPSLHFSYPLLAGRQGREGAVSAALDLRWLARRLSEVPLPAGGSVLVADRNGTILGRWPEPERYTGQALAPRLVQRLGSDDYSSGTGPGIDGVRRLYAVSPLGARPHGLFVGVGIDPAPAEAALAAANWRGMLLIAGGGLAALALGLLVAGRFLERPVEALIGAMERWRDGHLDARAAADPRIGDGGEFGRIALAFDAAVAEVAAREASLRESEARFQQIAEALEDALLISEPEHRRVLYASPALGRLAGWPAEAPGPGFDALLGAVHPEDRAAVQALVTHSPPVAFETEYRLCRADGTVRRMQHRRFLVPGCARVVCIISDVTEERDAAERQTLLAREVDHRAKNVLAVVLSILRLTRADSPKEFAAAVEDRVSALARAHQLLARGGWGGADLAELLREELAPYAGAQRCLLEGPALRLRAEAVQPLAMVIHELATNSAKHGAFSMPGGRLRVAWRPEAEDGPPTRLRLVWEESGGPPLAGPPARRGFGTRVIGVTVERQLQGTLHTEWRAEGMRCLLLLPLEVLSRAAGQEPATLTMAAD